MLKTVTISKGQADQRKGRAGREQAGRCWRLYTEPAFETMKDAATPEIQRVDLAEVVLQLKVAGVADVSAFEFVAPPSTAALKHALETLTALGAIAKTGALTDHGRRMALLPLAPVWAHTLLQAPKFGCVAEILTAAAMLSVDHIWIVPVSVERSELRPCHALAIELATSPCRTSPSSELANRPTNRSTVRPTN